MSIWRKTGSKTLGGLEGRGGSEIKTSHPCYQGTACRRWWQYLCGLPPETCRVGGPHHWLVRQSSHLEAVPLEEPDFAAAHAKAPPVHLMWPKKHATLLVPREDGVLELHVPFMQALRQIREVEWHSLAVRTRGLTPLARACEAPPLGAVHHGPRQRDVLRARDGRLPTMQVMRRWWQKVTRTVTPAHPCIF